MRSLTNFTTMNWKPIMRLLCHQKEERSYSMCGETLLVCSRCLGIYVGFLISLVFLIATFWLFTKSLNFAYAILLLVPMGIDGVSQLFGFRESNNPLRFFTGYLAGFSVALVFYTVIARLLYFPTSGALPNPASLAPLVLIPFFIGILEKYNNSKSVFLKKTLNFIAIFTVLFLLAAVVFLYALMLRNYFLTLAR